MEEKRECRISDEQFEAIAKRAAELAREKFYESVGRAVVGTVLRYGGAGLCVIALWEAARQALK